MPDADTRDALLLILVVLERHSRALRTLLARAGHPELKGLLGDFERRERALREAAWELRSLEACRATGPSRRNGGDDGPARQGVLPLPEPNSTTDAAATARVIPSAVERRSENLGTGGAMANGTAWTTKPGFPRYLGFQLTSRADSAIGISGIDADGWARDGGRDG